MARREKFEVQGLKELQKQLREFDQDIIKSATRRAARDAMKPVEERAKDLVPVDKGSLRDSIKLSAGSTDQGEQNRVAWAVVKAGGRGQKDANGRMPGQYVLSMHYGNSKGDEETPFLLDAFEPYAQDIANDYRKHLKTETEKGVKKMARRAKKNNKRG